MHHTLLEERISIFVGANAIIQFVGDVVLEAMGLIPPRINHLSLTFLNAFISFKTLSAIQKDKFRFLHEDCQIFWLLEVLLIVGDVYYSFKDSWGRRFILLRLFFVCCSLFNWAFISYIIMKYKLYHITYQGSGDEENEDFIQKERDDDDSNGSRSSRVAMNKQISVNDNNTNMNMNTNKSGGRDGERKQMPQDMQLAVDRKVDSAQSVPPTEEEEAQSADDSLSHGHAHKNGHEHAVEMALSDKMSGSFTGKSHSEVP